MSVAKERLLGGGRTTQKPLLTLDETYARYRRDFHSKSRSSDLTSLFPTTSLFPLRFLFPLATGLSGHWPLFPLATGLERRPVPLLALPSSRDASADEALRSRFDFNLRRCRCLAPLLAAGGRVRFSERPGFVACLARVLEAGRNLCERKHQLSKASRLARA
jgi:hypothetical protein